TLYTSGGGNTRMLVTLAAFIAGSVIGVLHMPWWEKLPALKPISLIGTLGVAPALAISLAVFATISAITLAVERRAGPGGQIGVGSGSDRGQLGVRPRAKPQFSGQLLRGPCPLAAGALGLAAVNNGTLALAG